MHNPIRRSKKIGLTQGGRVKDGRPYEKWSRLFGTDVWESLSEQDLPRWHVIRENPSRDFFHPVGETEIHAVLAKLPADLTSPIRAIVLRRTPKMDEALGVEARRRFSCVLLNAFPKSLEVEFGPDPGPIGRRHYRPWTEDWFQRSQVWRLRWTRQAVKRYYLYHLLLHEVGHLHQPKTVSHKRREAYAENFALQWGRRLAGV